VFNSPNGEVPWDDLRKIFGGCQQTAKVPNAVEILPKISTAWVGRTNVTDDSQTDGWQTDGRQQIANMNVSSRSLKIKTNSQYNWICNFATVVCKHKINISRKIIKPNIITQKQTAFEDVQKHTSAVSIQQMRRPSDAQMDYLYNNKENISISAKKNF